MTPNSTTKARHPDNIIELQEDINKLEDWANKWQIKFNVDEFAVMRIGHNNINGNYTMTNQQLPVTELQTDLGIIITYDLKWQQQTEKSYKTANRVLGFIAGNFKYKAREMMHCTNLLSLHTWNMQYNSGSLIYNET